MRFITGQGGKYAGARTELECSSLFILRLNRRLRAGEGEERELKAHSHSGSYRFVKHLRKPAAVLW